jgi:hypothetical protein
MTPEMDEIHAVIVGRREDAGELRIYNTQFQMLLPGYHIDNVDVEVNTLLVLVFKRERSVRGARCHDQFPVVWMDGGGPDGASGRRGGQGKYEFFYSGIAPGDW